jgi:hypothetical protein
MHRPDARRLSGCYRTDLAEAALEGIEEDANGEDYEKEEVEVTAGGE